MSILVEFPDALLVAAREDPDAFGRDVMVHTLGRLYSAGKVSAGLATQILDCDRLTFFRLLAERGYAAIDLGDADLANEALAAQALAESLKG
jgi:predicted HTH domain antitoxin